ncbi:MAG: anhydro-N-acetylmuramic acid kinase [Burkholderiaceae bacterium]|nr:anhydro-N-acetylmuramic acid kinase [Burkholderiaceae bacterium]
MATPDQSRDPLYLGLMSGTSLDAIDGALVRWCADGPVTLAFTSQDFDPSLRAELLALQSPGPDELHRASVAAAALARAYAQVCTPLIQHAPPGAVVAAIGAHGQTVRHRPEAGYTIQLLNGALLAELTGCAVVCDFRSADIAAGGQGAPLVPAFHARVFSSPSQRRAIVNLGGIANVSLLSPSGEVTGFDTGPANVLMDLWATRTLGKPLDTDGALAASGRVDPPLLELLLDEPYFSRAAPKSTGRDLFNADWLDSRLRRRMAAAEPQPSPADIQATLAELTARTVADACRGFAADAIFLCGGGALNPVLRRRIAALCPATSVDDTGALGAPPQAVEAVAFAWLAHCRLTGLPGNLPAVTGARGSRVSGALHPGKGQAR